MASARLIGHGDEKAADQAAVDAMRQALNVLEIDGTVVIGEGERDEAPMLYIGEKVGTGQRSAKIDIALDPLEGTTITATGSAECDFLYRDGTARLLPQCARHLHGQDRRRHAACRKGVIKLTDSSGRQSRPPGRGQGSAQVDELVVLILDRPRHQGSDLSRAQGRGAGSG